VTKSLSLRIYPRYICVNPPGFNRPFSKRDDRTTRMKLKQEMHPGMVYQYVNKRKLILLNLSFFKYHEWFSYISLVTHDKRKKNVVKIMNHYRNKTYERKTLKEIFYYTKGWV
jgi:hypothetical protein